MKKRYAILTCLLLLALNACKKWVEYDPRDDFKITAQDYLKSEANYRDMAVGVYAPLRWLNQVVPIGDIASDNAVTGGESATDVLALQQIDDFALYPINDALREIWVSAYEGINRANYLHQYKAANSDGQAIDFAGKEALYGEIYFLRAYYYFTLTRMFGDIPLFLDKRLGISESKTLSRTAQAAVYAAIETDLTNAIKVLPTVQTEKGRVTKYAAQALLGKVYLYEKKYDAAVPVLESVITSNAFTLVSDFASIFLESGENGTESVFEIQYTNGQPTYAWAYPTRNSGNLAVQQCGVRQIAGSSDMPYAPGWSTNLPTANLANAFAAGDKRKDATILDIEAYKKANPSYNVEYQVAPYKNTGLYNQKYLPRKGQTSGQVELNYLNNFRTIRYAEVLLMAAEANNRATAANDTKAQQYLNQVRRRAFGDTNHDVTLSGTALYDAILAERRLELAMEGDRFFDLVRTGKAATVLSSLGFKAGKHELFPLPQDEVASSGWTNNPNY